MKRARKVRGAKPGTLALIVAGAVAVALAFGLFVVDLAGEQLIQRRQHLVAETARDYFVAFAHQEGLPAMARALDHRARNENGAFAYAVFDNDGTRLGGSALLSATDLPEPGYGIRQVAGADYEVLVQPMAVGGTLAIYENLADRRAFHRAILEAVGAVLLFSLAIVAAAALILGRLLVGRAEGIALAAETIAAGDLSARAPVAGVGDVFDELAGGVNAMLARIEELMTGMRTVTDSLSHDLRSPLTRLRGALHRAQDQELAEDERLVLIAEAQAQCEEVLATFSALLDIARAESGLSRDLMAPLDLAEMVRDLGDLFEPVIEDAGQTLAIEATAEAAPFVGHELILRQALGNLLHNAARYAGEGVTVTLALSLREDGGVDLIVTDTGKGVPAADRGRVVERFVRLDETRSTSGSGLGLAIAAACAKLHGGQLRLEDNRPGLRVVLTLPPR